MKLTNNNVHVVNPFSGSANGTTEKICRQHYEEKKRKEIRSRKQYAKFVAGLGSGRDWLCYGESSEIPIGKSQKRPRTDGISCLGIVVAVIIMVALALLIGNI